MSFSYVDVANLDFVKEIKCDKVVNDFFPISNLTKNKQIIRSNLPSSSLGVHSKQNGFMVERFVKPPVTIILEFRNSLNLTAIDIGLRVGSQITLSLEIYVGYLENLLKKVASFNQSNAEESVSSVRFCVKNKEEEIEKNFGCSVVNFYKTDQLTNCKFLAVKICKAEHVPCLSALKVWSYQSVKLDLPNLPEEECSRLETCTKSNEEIEEIPEDFYDPITCECMSLPVVLPAGRTVDRSTLEKYISVEATCGRAPNDPYTGVKFTENSFPMANVCLKGRIDKFFLENPQIATKIQFGRTLCGKNYSAWPLKRH